jgi:hypothetical protein
LTHVRDALLHVHAQGQPPGQHRLERDRTSTVIGRAPDCGLVISHPSVSRRHARLVVSDEGWSIEDLGSANGVRIDGVPVATQVLRDGQWFSLGDVFCEFRTLPADGGMGDARRERDVRRQSGAWLARITRASGEDDLLATLLGGWVELAGCQRGLFLGGHPADGFRCLASRGISPARLDSPGFVGSSGALARAIESRAPVIVHDPALFDWSRRRASIIEHDIHALLVWPLFFQSRLLGLAYADSREPGKVFSALELDLLAGFMAEATRVLHARGIDAALQDLSRCLDVDARGTAVGALPVVAWRP